jgi:hypothetical protein
MRKHTKLLLACALSALALALLLAQLTPASQGQTLVAEQAATANTLLSGDDNNGDDDNGDDDDRALDHFRCYDIQSQQIPAEPVNLNDQFTEQDAVVTDSRLFCNPVEKTHGTKVTRIRNQKGHLTVYDAIPTEIVVREVIVHNQFGLQELRVVGPFFLFVPTEKEPHGRPRGLDHFWCYVTSGTPPAPGVAVGLKDQFREDTVTVGPPFVLCNPVRKIHDNVVTRIQNEEDHLVCYDIGLTQNFRTITVHNQFVDGQLLAEESLALCVPSAKCPPQNDLDNDGVIDSRETLLGTLLTVADSDGDGIKDGNEDSDDDGEDDEDEDDDDECPDEDSDGDGEDDEDEDDDDDDD